MKIQTIMGVNIEHHFRRRSECSIVVLKQEGQITVLSCEHHDGEVADLIRRVVEAVRTCPDEIDEIMAGNEETMRILLTCLKGQIRLNMPRRRIPSGEHVIACINRLQYQN